VINWSYADRAVRLNLPVQVSYGDNPRREDARAGGTRHRVW
jgi:small-conductance mechanosensitive channel